MEQPSQLVVSDSIVHEFPDIYANTMAVDSTGRFAVLCSRKCMIIVELDNSTPTSKKLARNSKWDPGSSQFNCILKDLFAVTTYQAVDIFSIQDNASTPKYTLRGHTRVITDIDWSHFDQYMLASSSADCTTNLWDFRDNRRPVSTLTSVSGATQVKFCKTSSNLVATSHEIDVRIWDTRQPNLPLHYIAAHLQKINGLDWNPHIGDQIVTCSQDCSIRLWDLSANKIKPGLSAVSKSSAWRIRHTPFSSVGVVTSILPQLSSRDECNSLNLWFIRSYRFEKRFELLSTLVGHTDIVIDFDWRVKNGTGCGEAGDAECELVSWSKDQTLRIWRLDHQLTELQTDISDSETEGDIETGCADEEVTTILRKSAADKLETEPNPTNTSGLMKNLRLGSSSKDKTPNNTLDANGGSSEISNALSDQAKDLLTSPQELQQEFALINKNIPNVVFEELNPLRRLCLINARANNVSCRLRIALPPSYPHNESPTFTIIDATHPGSENLTNDAREKLLNGLNETAQLQLSRNRNCLEPCIRKFITALQRLTVPRMRRKGSLAENITKDDPITISMQRDHSVPFPRTSGARFSGDLLVCFGRPMLQTSQPSATSRSTGEVAPRPSWLVETPRTMAQLSAFLDNRRKQSNYTYMLSNISISHFYYGASRPQSKQLISNQRLPKSMHRASGRMGQQHPQSTVIARSLKCGPVLVCDVSAIQMGAISRYLADNYVFDHDVIAMCRRNAEVSASCGRKDLVQVWNLAELSAEGVLHSNASRMQHLTSDNAIGKAPSPSSCYPSLLSDKPWTLHPFGGKLIQSLISHYVNNCHDVQTAAMLIWTFSSPRLAFSPPRPQASGGPNSIANLRSHMNHMGRLNSIGQTAALSPYYKIGPNNMISTGGGNLLACTVADSNSEDWNLVTSIESRQRSNSWSDTNENDMNASLDLSWRDKMSHDLAINENANYSAAANQFLNNGILDPEKSLQNDMIKQVYAQVLYRWNLLNQSAMLLKNAGPSPRPPTHFTASPSDAQLYSESSCSVTAIEQSAPTDTNPLPNLVNVCQSCKTNCHSVICPNCKFYSLFCSICQLPVKGTSSMCTSCFHGGHVVHFDAWFKNYDFCPTGCGCRCLSIVTN